jgi:rhodanese-related sulfurtransferase
MFIVDKLFKKEKDDEEKILEYITSHSERLAPAKPDFPDYDIFKDKFLVDIRDEESIEDLGSYPNSTFVEFDDNFLEKMQEHKNEKILLLDERCNDVLEASEILKENGFDVEYVNGGLYYLRDVMNIRPEGGVL